MIHTILMITVPQYKMRICRCNITDVAGITLGEYVGHDLKNCSYLCSDERSCFAFQFSHQNSTCVLLNSSCKEEPLEPIFWNYLYEKGILLIVI